MKCPNLPSILLFTAALGLSTPARAEETATLALAEKAYAEVDFEQTFALARAALERGGHDTDEAKRLYTLLGISLAALEREDEAREAFRRVIAIDPALRLDQTLSPKMRAPYLEARGSLSASGDARPLEARLERAGQAFAIELHDAARVARSIELELRTPGAASARKLRLTAEPRTELGDSARLPEHFSYVLSVRDEHDNRLFRTTGEVLPETAPLTAAEVLESAAPPAAHDAGRPNRTPYFVTAGVLAALGVGAVSGGVVAQLRREDAAEEWNSQSCEVPGQTRGEQCESVDARRKSAEYWAIGLYSAGGALLLGSMLTLVLTPDSPAPRSAGSLGLACLPSLGPQVLAGAVCRGRF